MSSGYHDSLNLWKHLLETGLNDDDWTWDWTTRGLPSPDALIKAHVVAKSEGIWVAESLVGAIENIGSGISKNFTARSRIKMGDRVKPGTVVTEWSGSARAILALERPFLNLAGYVSGIATVTRKLVDEVHQACPKNPPRVTATRKTLPGYRDVAILGVMAGGGYSHRVGLSGGVLIKENHIAAAGGIAKAIHGAKAVAPHGLKIEIEVRSLGELEKAIVARADGVLLDNFTPAQVGSALKLLKRLLPAERPLVEVSGGLTEENIGEYALEGVDVLSSGSLTHSVRAVDFSLLVTD